MTDKDRKFHKNQKKKMPIGRSESFVDCQWEVSNQRRQKKKKNVTVTKAMIKAWVKLVKKKSRWLLEMTQCATMIKLSKKIKKKQFWKKEVFTDETDDPPENDLSYKYRHICAGLKSVRLEYYTVRITLQSEHHMSGDQSHGAIIAVANYLLGQKWKNMLQI